MFLSCPQPLEEPIGDSAAFVVRNNLVPHSQCKEKVACCVPTIFRNFQYFITPIMACKNLYGQYNSGNSELENRFQDLISEHCRDSAHKLQ